MQLTQKECSLLKDMKGQEELCIQKYSNASSSASDGQLKGLFSYLADIERGHLHTLQQIEGGTVPTMNASGSQGGQSGSQGSQNGPVNSFSETYTAEETDRKRHDCFLCTDLLTSEKHASHLYDTCVFEFKDAGVRDAINHIQKEEQNHGKMIYDYMSANHMYS